MPVDLRSKYQFLLIAIFFLITGFQYTFFAGTGLAQQRKIIKKIPIPKAIQNAFERKTRSETGDPGVNYWQLETDFDIDVQLDPEKGILAGHEVITIHNKSPDELTEIVLRLDHNIFRKENPRAGSVPAEFTKGMVVEKILIDNRKVLLGRKNGNGDYATGLKLTSAVVHLSKPIKPRSKASLEIQWRTKLPGGNNGRGHRMTQRWKKLFQPTQWFPRLAKYDDLRGWDRNQYRGPAEFYNNFGKFDVKIDVPAGWIVSATGTLQNAEEILTQPVRDRIANILSSDDEIFIVKPEETGKGKAVKGGDRLVWHFKADYVNDFAWSTAENYIWKATRVKIPGKGFIPIHMYFLPNRAHLFQNAGRITKHALTFYSKLWAPYPFPKMALQDGPSAGMEYPMVINSNQGAADHEVAHQWWPMLLGTNETDFGWMDEGLNVYMNSLSRADNQGRVGNFNGRGQSYQGAANGSPTLMSSSNTAGRMYGFLAYQKTTLMLSMLGGIVGDEEVKRAIKEYTEKWKFKHPSPWDFVNSMNKSLGKDLDWFWYYWLFTNETVDGSIRSVKQQDNLISVVVRQTGKMPAPVVLRVYLAAGGQKVPESDQIKVLADGSIIVRWPVDVWKNGNQSLDLKFDIGKNEIRKIVLDPYGRFPDRDKRDNNWPRR